MTNDIFNDIIDNIELEKELDMNFLIFSTGNYFTIDEVVSKSNYLDEEYKYVYEPLGFNNFYDLFIYCQSNTESVYKGGNKDLGNLNKVKRKVMRNGKEIEMTVYESNGEEDENMDNSKQQQKDTTRSAMTARISTNGDREGKVNTKKLSNTLNNLKKQGADTQGIDTTASLFHTFEDATGTMGVAIYNHEDDYIELTGYTSTPDSESVGTRSIFELIKLGIENEKEVRVYLVTLPEAIEFLEFLGFKEKEDYFVLSKKDVLDFLGDYSDFI